MTYLSRDGGLYGTTKPTYPQHECQHSNDRLGGYAGRCPYCCGAVFRDRRFGGAYCPDCRERLEPWEYRAS